MALTGRITEWNRERGFGYLDAGGRRIFLHIRDFAERHKPPEVGDVIGFVLGADQQGRPCAQQASHVNDGGRFRSWHFLLVAVLLVLPAWATLHTVGRIGLGYAAGGVAGMSGLTFLIYALDKRRARAKAWREPEIHLHLLELLGGWPGAFLAQRKLRHKATKGPYQFAFVLIIGLHQAIAIDALRGWPLVRLLIQSVRESP